MKFKVMTWNVENLFRPKEGGPSTTSIYQQKLAGLASAIRTLEPDVLALQEIGTPEALADLQDALGGAYPNAALSRHPDVRGIRVAFLAKLAFGEITECVDLAPNPSFALSNLEGKPITAMCRGSLGVSVQCEALRVRLITAHFKSKLLQYPTSKGGSAFTTTDEALRARVAGLALAQRTAEAFTLRTAAARALTTNEQDALILLGDLNDGPDAATTQLLLGPEGSQPGTAAFTHPDKADRTRMFNLANLIPSEKRYSRINNGVRELIDHILLSHHLLPAGSDGTPRVPEVLSHPELQGIRSVGTDPRARRDEVCSDHAPVTLGVEI